MKAIYTAIEAWGIHRYGWLVISGVLIVPAIVSGNLVQFYLTQAWRREVPLARLIKPIIGNALVMLTCATVIATALYLYL